MSTVRAFSNSKRLSTGRETKDGRFFQAYPEKLYYVNQNAWRDEWMKKGDITFKVELNKKTLKNLFEDDDDDINNRFVKILEIILEKQANNNIE